MTRRLGLVAAAVALGLSPLLAGLVAELRGRVMAHTPVRSVVQRDQDPAPRFSPGPRLPKGCLLRLQDARPDRWCLLVEWDVDHEKVVRPLRRLRPGRAAWVLRGAGMLQPEESGLVSPRIGKMCMKLPPANSTTSRMANRKLGIA